MSFGGLEVYTDEGDGKVAVAELLIVAAVEYLADGGLGSLVQNRRNRMD